MSVPYEKVVGEDLNLGHGTVSVTMPGGGSATGNKIGIHTLLPGLYNVKDFGALGDGETDDTAAIQAAVNAAAAAKAGIFFPPTATSYKVNSALTNTSRVMYVFWGETAKFSGAGAPKSNLVRLDYPVVPQLQAFQTF